MRIARAFAFNPHYVVILLLLSCLRADAICSVSWVRCSTAPSITLLLNVADVQTTSGSAWLHYTVFLNPKRDSRNTVHAPNRILYNYYKRKTHPKNWQIPFKPKTFVMKLCVIDNVISLSYYMSTRAISGKITISTSHCINIITKCYKRFLHTCSVCRQWCIEAWTEYLQDMHFLMMDILSMQQSFSSEHHLYLQPIESPERTTQYPRKQHRTASNHQPIFSTHARLQNPIWENHKTIAI
jgi:hypothetical protein